MILLACLDTEVVLIFYLDHNIDLSSVVFQRLNCSCRMTTTAIGLAECRTYSYFGVGSGINFLVICGLALFYDNSKTDKTLSFSEMLNTVNL